MPTIAGRLSCSPTKGESLSSVAFDLAGVRGRGLLTGLRLASPVSPASPTQLHPSGKPPISFLLSIGGLLGLFNPCSDLLCSLSLSLCLHFHLHLQQMAWPLNGSQEHAGKQSRRQAGAK